MLFTKESILANLEVVEDEISSCKKRFNENADLTHTHILDHYGQIVSRYRKELKLYAVELRDTLKENFDTDLFGKSVKEYYRESVKNLNETEK